MFCNSTYLSSLWYDSDKTSVRRQVYVCIAVIPGRWRPSLERVNELSVHLDTASLVYVIFSIYLHSDCYYKSLWVYELGDAFCLSLLFTFVSAIFGANQTTKWPKSSSKNMFLVSLLKLLLHSVLLQRLINRNDKV